MTIQNRRYVFLTVAIIWTFHNFQVLSFPSSETASKQGIFRQTGTGEFNNGADLISVYPRQESEAAEPDRPRLDDFIQGLNSIFTGLLTLDLKNVVGGSFQFIPRRLRQGVEGIVHAVMGKPRATTTVSSILYPETTINGTTISNLESGTGELENELEADEEREE